MTKMAVYVIMLSISALLDKITSLDTIISALSVCSVFLSVTESLSALENISALGFSTPKKLIDMLRFAQGQISGDDPGPKKP
jgi:phage-related holin